jgi:hypothetical protein
MVKFAFACSQTQAQLIEGYDNWLLKDEYEYKIDGNKLFFSKEASYGGHNHNFEFKLNKKVRK